ncbi:MAG: hypothetical protein GF417_03440, partial [Candidatus Latescibacteria bacterium]|nr:hypothetical protein [bacterium]MBD3423482.1 hypothetical protein [Candidatus Latescibacterota bacterium]
LIVERLIGEREVVIKEVRKTFINTRGISGVSIMGDGSVVLVIDIAELIRSEGISYMRRMSGID